MPLSLWEVNAYYLSTGTLDRNKNQTLDKSVQEILIFSMYILNKGKYKNAQNNYKLYILR
jgi:hypothetical protein